MEEVFVMKLRIKFAKYGPVKFIGHLDMMRYFQKAIRRSGINIAYSEGYSPHQIMSFAQPLGVGLESQGEYLDIEVKTYTNSLDMKNQLNAVMAEGVKIISVRQLPDQTGNAMASVAAARYQVTFREGCEPSFNWEEELINFYNNPIIMVTKKTKKSEKEMDIKPSIYELFLEAQTINTKEIMDNKYETKNDMTANTDIKDTPTKTSINMLVDASSGGNIKPILVMTAFFDEHGQTLPEFALEVTRLDTYGKRELDGQIEYLPLEEFGNEWV